MRHKTNHVHGWLVVATLAKASQAINRRSSHCCRLPASFRFTFKILHWKAKANSLRFLFVKIFCGQKFIRNIFQTWCTKSSWRMCAHCTHRYSFQLIAWLGDTLTAISCFHDTHLISASDLPILPVHRLTPPVILWISKIQTWFYLSSKEIMSTAGPSVKDLFSSKVLPVSASMESVDLLKVRGYSPLVFAGSVMLRCNIFCHSELVCRKTQHNFSVACWCKQRKIICCWEERGHQRLWRWLHPGPPNRAGIAGNYPENIERLADHCAIGFSDHFAVVVRVRSHSETSEDCVTFVGLSLRLIDWLEALLVKRSIDLLVDWLMGCF